MLVFFYFVVFRIVTNISHICRERFSWETADLIWFPLLDSIQSDHVSQSHLFLVHQSQPSKGGEQLWGRGCHFQRREKFWERGCGSSSHSQTIWTDSSPLFASSSKIASRIGRRGTEYEISQCSCRHQARMSAIEFGWQKRRLKPFACFILALNQCQKETNIKLNHKIKYMTLYSSWQVKHDPVQNTSEQKLILCPCVILIIFPSSLMKKLLCFFHNWRGW